MKQEIEKRPISRLAEFSDVTLEEEYYQQVIDASKKYSRFVILIAGILYSFLIVVDYHYSFFINAYSSSQSMFVRCALSRIMILAISILFFIALSKVNHPRVACLFITLFPLLVTLSYIYTLTQYRAQSFPSQAMVIMVMIFFTTLMPNKWINLVFIDVCMVVVFLAVAPRHTRGVSMGTQLATAACLIFTLLFAIITQYRMNKNLREKHLREKQLESMTVTDRLTNAYNRLWFDQTFAEWCSDGENSREFSLILMDIDDFKRVNDTYGHLTGDKVLVEFSRLIQRGVRQGDMLARWGGEEFMLLLPDIDLVKAAALAERMRQTMEQHHFEGPDKVTCSFGVVTRQKGESMKSLLTRVDEQLYRAKNNGKNQVASA